jgi:hypothetical protein
MTDTPFCTETLLFCSEVYRLSRSFACLYQDRVLQADSSSVQYFTICLLHDVLTVPP